MKILLISGHGAGDNGACANGYKEADLTREVVNILKEKLKRYADIDVYNQTRDAFKDVNNGNIQVNFANYNYVLEIHFNSFNGSAKGTEIYTTRIENAKTVEEKIMNKLSKFFTVRGVKEKNFNVIYSAKKKGVSSALLEVCFIDNTEDIQTYQNNKDAICQAICDGVAEGFGLKEGEHTTGEVGKTNNNNWEEFNMPKTWKNGTKPEIVYGDVNCTKKIGTIYPQEYAECFGIMQGKYIVAYYITDSEGKVLNRKVGFVKYNGGL